MKFQKILCVCTGNICRSPLAKGLLKREAPGLTVDSAGIGAIVGGKMPAEAAVIAEREQLALQGHRGKQLTSSLAAASDIILVMEKGQQEWVTSHFPQVRGRVFLATHWTDGKDVDDPYRHNAAFFEKVYAHMAKGILSWADKLGKK